jgi:hypothetical protein
MWRGAKVKLKPNKLISHHHSGKMKCSKCGGEMEHGNVSLSEGSAAVWHKLDEPKHIWFAEVDGEPLVNASPIQTRYIESFLCRNCNLVTMVIPPQEAGFPGTKS